MIRIFKRGDSKRKELEALLIQQSAILEKIREENEKLRKKLENAEKRLESAVKLFFPKLYSEKKPSSLEDFITVLVEGLDELRNREYREGSTLAAPSLKSIEDSQPMVDSEAIKVRLGRLEPVEREILKLVLEGFCTVKSVSEELRVGRNRAEKLLEKLRRIGFLDVLKIKSRSRHRTFRVYFPSPHGEVASEVLLGKPWSMLHSEVLKEKGLYMGNGELIKEAETRLRHAGYRVITELEEPSECYFKYSNGSHRADLAVYAVNSSGREVKVLIECESMSNPISQVMKMLDAYYEIFNKIYLVVSSGIAKRMMIQRVCYWAWRRREKEGLVFEVRVEAVDRLARLSSMSKFTVVRPSSK